MDNSFKSVLDKSKTILILLPTKPFFDQVASGLALYLALRENRQVSIACPTPMTVEFNRLIGVNKIAQELGDKNLIIRFVEYKASDIERVSYDIENSQFRLTVIPKQNINPPSKDQVEIAYSGISAGTVIIVGGASESHFPAISSKDLVGADIVHVGTKDISLSSNKSYISFSRPASSVSEVLYSLIKESGFKMDEDIATNLLMGIEEGSNRFSDETMSADTFIAIGELMRLGGKRNFAPRALQKENFPPGSVPGGLNPTQTSQSEQQTTIQKQKTEETNTSKAKEDDQAPKDWLEPKIFKGTSIS
jgi:hypothetical protein